jgi:hypothetical protein
MKNIRSFFNLITYVKSFVVKLDMQTKYGLESQFFVLEKNPRINFIALNIIYGRNFCEDFQTNYLRLKY